MTEKALPPLAPELTPTASLETLRLGRCRWPIGNPREPSFGFCGRSSGPAIYCQHHQGIAYRSPIIVQRGVRVKDSWL